MTSLTETAFKRKTMKPNDSCGAPYEVCTACLAPNAHISVSNNRLNIYSKTNPAHIYINIVNVGTSCLFCVKRWTASSVVPGSWQRERRLATRTLLMVSFCVLRKQVPACALFTLCLSKSASVFQQLRVSPLALVHTIPITCSRSYSRTLCPVS